MHYFKKVFFLILLAGLIIAPQAVQATVPTVSFVPGDNEKDVPVNANILISFDRKVRKANGDQITNSNAGQLVYLREATRNGPNVTSVVTIIDPKTQITINPTNNLKNSQIYFAGILDAEVESDESEPTGNEISETFVQFTTSAGAPADTGPKAGDFCNPTVADSCGASVDSGMSCEKETGFDDKGYCVPLAANRKIGTWCNKVGHCTPETGNLQLTCDDDENRCVGSVAGVPCMNEDVNKKSVWGDTADQMDSSDRCDTGLYCDPNKKSCQNDFGQAKIPSDKLGQAAEDIRDQIRNIINIALGFLGVAGVIVTIYGGALWMSAAGDDEKVGKAKKTIVSGLIGLVIIGIAWTIVSYVLSITQDIS